MPKPGRRHIPVLVLIMVAAITAGCATVADQRVDLIYKDAASASGGSGNIFLVVETPPHSGATAPIHWVLGGITNGNGKNLGNIFTDISPIDLLTNAFVLEFKRAGYKIVQENIMPQEVAKGMKLKSATIRLEEVKNPFPFTVDAKCQVKISVEPWQNGKPMNKLEYEADYTNSTIFDRNEILSKTMLQAIQSIMARSVSEIVRMIEQH